MYDRISNQIGEIRFSTKTGYLAYRLNDSFPPEDVTKAFESLSEALPRELLAPWQQGDKSAAPDENGWRVVVKGGA